MYGLTLDELEAEIHRLDGTDDLPPAGSPGAIATPSPRASHRARGGRAAAPAQPGEVGCAGRH